MNQKQKIYAVTKKNKVGNDFCKNPDCGNYNVRYCRQHLGYVVPVKEEIEKVSEKKKELDKEYLKVRKHYLTAHPFCEAQIEEVCTKVAMDIHHKQGRVGEDDYLKPANFLAVCRQCHKVIEANPAFARQQGFSNSRLSQPAKNQNITYKKRA